MRVDGDRDLDVHHGRRFVCLRFAVVQCVGVVRVEEEEVRGLENVPLHIVDLHIPMLRGLLTCRLPLCPRPRLVLRPDTADEQVIRDAVVHVRKCIRVGVQVGGSIGGAVGEKVAVCALRVVEGGRFMRR